MRAPSQALLPGEEAPPFLTVRVSIIMVEREHIESPPTVVMVAGPPRSGTTLLANLLSGSPAHPLLPECQIITGLIRERLRGEREQGEDRFRVFLHDRAFADSVYRNAIESILAEILARSDSSARFMVLKDPFLTFYLGVVDRLLSWPLRKVCIVRDPRDVIASYISVRVRAGITPPLCEKRSTSWNRSTKRSFVCRRVLTPCWSGTRIWFGRTAEFNCG